MIMAFGGLEHTEEDCQSFFGKSFQECKKEVGLLPFGQLPLLEVNENGKKTLLAQSGTINRYLAKLAHCAPEDPLAAAECDMWHEAALELATVNPVVNVFRGAMFEEKKKHYFEEVLPNKLPRLAAGLGDKDFFTGDGSTPTYADFALYHGLDVTRLVEPQVYDSYPNIQGFLERVEELPGVREYLNIRPVPIDIGTKPVLQPRT